jgi:hypothetical protein
VRVIFLVLSIFIASCTIHSTSNGDDFYYGIWAVDPASEGVPDECTDVVMEIRRDQSMRMESGAQVISSSFETEKVSDSSYILKQDNVTLNGLPNCQGFSAEFVLSQYTYDIHVEQQGEKLKLQFGDDNSATFVMLEKF